MSNNTTAVAVITSTESLKGYFLEPRRPGEKIWITSNVIADLFEIRHDNVLQAFRNLQCSREFRHTNFQESSYRNKQNKEQPNVRMTRDGFIFISMGFNSVRAGQFKEMILARFNVLEKYYFDREGYTAAANKKLVNRTVHAMLSAGYDRDRVTRELAPTSAQRDEKQLTDLCDVFGVSQDGDNRDVFGVER